eukprot:SAG25_NODE_338_length_9538_cov_22.622630_9_plen_111_part_00
MCPLVGFMLEKATVGATTPPSCAWKSLKNRTVLVVVSASSIPAMARPNSSRSNSIPCSPDCVMPKSSCRVPGLTTRLSFTFCVVTKRVSTWYCENRSDCDGGMNCWVGLT